jgi:hypothetical protein
MRFLDRDGEFLFYWNFPITEELTFFLYNIGKGAGV